MVGLGYDDLGPTWKGNTEKKIIVKVPNLLQVNLIDHKHVHGIIP